MLVIGLGLLMSLAAAGSAIWDARQPASPFDQVGDGGVERGICSDHCPRGEMRPAEAAAQRLPPRNHRPEWPGAHPPPATTAHKSGATRQPTVTAAQPPRDHGRGLPRRQPSPLPISIPDRIVIPAIKLDAPAVPAKLKDIEYQGQLYQQWVAPDKFAAGWLTTSATLGLPGNTVFSGHNNLHGEVFGHLQDLRVGDLILAYSGARQFAYVDRSENDPARALRAAGRAPGERRVDSTFGRRTADPGHLLAI